MVLRLVYEQKLSYPVMENEYNNNSDGTYLWDREGCHGEPNDSKIPHWGLDFSVATYSGKIGDYCWELGIDGDPSDDSDFTTFDSISKTAMSVFFDHSFGTIGVAGESNSILKLGIDCTFSFLENARVCAQYYEELLANYNVAQNHFNFGFFSLPGTSLYYFDRSVSGNYAVYLRALDCKGSGEVVAESHVQILVGSAKKVEKPRLPDATGRISRP